MKKVNKEGDPMIPLSEIKEALQQAITTDVREQKLAYFEKTGSYIDHKYEFRCSECGALSWRISRPDDRFCSRCGARMIYGETV